MVEGNKVIDEDRVIILEDTIKELDEDGTTMSAYATYKGRTHEVHLNVFDPDSYEEQAYKQVMEQLHCIGNPYEGNAPVSMTPNTVGHVSNILALLRKYAISYPDA